MGIFSKIFGNYSDKELKRLRPIADQVMSLEQKYASMSDLQLREMTEAFKKQIADGMSLDTILPDAFAVCREASGRVLGMKHFYVQILGGIVLHQGRIAEMKTGEGKTLVATLPAYLNALTGKGVHIVTVNDYLARRDSEWMGKVYRFLGLSVGLVVPGMQPEDKKTAYAADITYCTNNELGFDYLRDNMVIYKENRVQRGHNFAIVDEVDSILIDEARTPLIISGRGEKSTDLYARADRFARSLKVTRIRETDSKKTDEEQDITGDYVVDEKAKTASLTKSGVKKAEEYFGVENINDSENIEIMHHIQQAIKAHGIMKKDADYVIKDGEIIIVDEFTGRLMYGRRYNEGLHQAIEAKEGVNVADESKTLATITFQNFFRLYSKLSGMTGTALTEEEEFREIYKLDVIEIPTNKPLIRIDRQDVIYKTERAKFAAVVEEIKKRHETGQPVLVGTITIENSEVLSRLLKANGVPHNVLNAKHHEREAEIIAQAGKFGAVTIATNMAGRGTDIMLGGNAEYLAKSELRKKGYTEEIISEATGYGETDDEDILKARAEYAEFYEKHKSQIAPEAERVRAVGGLCIIGTERHESRRIDNQLRGRAGRQGDPGESRFYIALEDDLMRLFGGERIFNMMERLNIDENTPIETGLLSSSIESAQRKVESRNFGIRKNVLEYDDVMNKQRELIYAERNRVLDGEDIKDSIKKMVYGTIDEICNRCMPANASPEDWNFDEMRSEMGGWLTVSNDFRYSTEQLNRLSPEDVARSLRDRADGIYEAKEKKYGNDLMREVERVILLRTVDTHWMDQIDAMDELRNGIGLRAYGQHNPVVEYRNEGYEMFNAMTDSIRLETAKRVMSVVIRDENKVEREKVAEESGTGEKGATVRGKGTVSKNALCPCGSGKKYKRCCGRNAE